jgi:DNA-binding NarL/FixJ family response regulator
MDPDVVTLDLKMPGISGIETLRKCGEWIPMSWWLSSRLRNPPECHRLHPIWGFRLHCKPFNVPEIMQIIEKSVQRKKVE